MDSWVYEFSVVIGSKTSLIFYCSLPTNNYIRKNLTNVFITIGDEFMQTSDPTFDKHKAESFLEHIMEAKWRGVFWKK